MRNSYAPDYGCSSAYYWHDYYYTVYEHWFKELGGHTNMPDYYDEILKACRTNFDQLTYQAGNNDEQKGLDTTNVINELYTYDMPYNQFYIDEQGLLHNDGQYKQTLYVNNSKIGFGTTGLFNPNNIMLPINRNIRLKANHKLRQNMQYYTDLVDGANVGWEHEYICIGSNAEKTWYYVEELPAHAADPNNLKRGYVYWDSIIDSTGNFQSPY